MLEPVAGVQVIAPGNDLHAGRSVGMTKEDGIQGVILFQLQRSPAPQLHLPGGRRIFLGFGPELGPRDVPGDPGSDVGVKPAKGPLGEASSKDRSERSISQVPSTQSIAMSDEATTTGQLQRHRFPMEVDADLVGEEGPSPPVVVPSDQVDRKAIVHQVSKDPQSPAIPSWDDRPVFEPEVEEVSIDDQE
jgi:hypothetical protein